MPPTRRDVSGRSDAAHLPTKMPLGTNAVLECWWISEDIQQRTQQAKSKSENSHISDSCSTAISSTPTQSERPSRKSATFSSQVQSPYASQDIRVPSIVELAAVPSALILFFCFAFFQLAKWSPTPGCSMV